MWILFIVSNRQYFCGVNTPYIKQNAVLSGVDTPLPKLYAIFLGGDYSAYTAQSIVFLEGWIHLLLGSTQ